VVSLARSLRVLIGRPLLAHDRNQPGDDPDQVRAGGRPMAEGAILATSVRPGKLGLQEVQLVSTLLHGSVVRRRGLDGISGGPFLILGRHRAIQSQPRSPSSHPEAAAQSDELGCL
jgi:hypothetical protein